MSSLSTSFGGFFERSISQMNALRGQVDRMQTQIATGARIERGSQDPAAAAALRVLDRRARLGEAAQDSAARLGQDLGLADRELQGVADVLQRARELAMAAASDPVGPKGRDTIAMELQQLASELFARANATSPEGSPLFAGLAAGPAFTRDASGAVSYAGTADVGAVPLAPGMAIERGLAGAQIFQFEVGGVPSDAFAVLGNLALALTSGADNPAAAARDAIAGLDSALDSVSRAQTIIGTRAAWVEMIQTEQRNQAVDLAARRSEVGDTQIADAIIRLQQSLTALEASQSAFARVSGLSLLRALS
jgi:flagellar hook-associated protein 3 FlgL